MQMDVYSKHAERFMAVLRPLLPADGPAGVLREWDYRYDADSPGADQCERFYRGLLLEILGATCGSEVAPYRLAETVIVPGFFSHLDRALLDQRSSPADDTDD